jgi:hydroxymethylpyrimidine pyrophosphatase-like HAD family hydrolase
VVLATGRSTWGTASIAHELGLLGPHITMNGGTYGSPVTGELVWARRLTPDLVVDGLVFAREIGSRPLLCFLHRHAAERGPDGTTSVPDFAVGPRLRVVDSLVDLAGHGPIRLYLPVPAREHPRVVAQARKFFGERASIVWGDESGIEVMAPGTNKGEALRLVAASMDLDMDQVAAVGDGPNDREMLEYAGRSAAMLPQPGAARLTGLVIGEATQVVPSSSDDGVLEALRRFFPSISFGWAKRTRSLRIAARPDRDDDPEPDLDSTAA